MDLPWQTEAFVSALDGVNSSVEPDLIGDSSLAWMMNGTMREGKPATRPPFTARMYLPQGLVQAAGYFSVQNGILIVTIAGRQYRIRVAQQSADFASEEIALPWQNSAKIPQTFYQETVGSFVIQDGQSAAIIYDGTIARRAVAPEVPIGRQMAYGSGRLWIAVARNTAVAGDIVTPEFQSELRFTETNYLSGGGTLSFPGDIQAMVFVPSRESADYGPLMIFGKDFGKLVRADITARDLWAQVPRFVAGTLTSIGAVGQWCVATVNQDVYWRDGEGGIRSLSNAFRNEQDAGSAPLSTEVSRVTDFESEQLLPFASAIYFDNRLLLTASPYLNLQGGVSFKNLISLDFNPLSSMRSKARAAYDGVWTGFGFAHLVTGLFDGKRRAFAISSDLDGENRLWEIGARGNIDSSEVGESPIVSFYETPRRHFGQPKNRKRLERCDVYLVDIEDKVTLQVYWRADNAQKWQEWAEVDVCAQMTDPATSTPHSWMNLRPQYRPQVKTFMIPQNDNPIVNFPMEVGFEFQLRVKWTGKARISRVLLFASVIDDPNYANRDLVPATCFYNDVTGNEIIYSIPIGVNAGRFLQTESGFDLLTESGHAILTG